MSNPAGSGTTDGQERRATPVELERRGPCAVIRINRPEARNAVNGAVAQGIEDAIDKIEADDERLGRDHHRRAPGVLAPAPTSRRSTPATPPTCRPSGAASPASCSASGPSPSSPRSTGLPWPAGPRSSWPATWWWRPPQPRSASPRSSARSWPALAALFRLGRKLPFNIAMELALTGDPITAELAHHHGLVNRLVEPGQALDAAIALAEQICANAPVAVRASRKVVVEATQAPDEVGWKMSMDGMAEAGQERGLPRGPDRVHREAAAPVEGSLSPTWPVAAGAHRASHGLSRGDRLVSARDDAVGRRGSRRARRPAATWIPRRGGPRRPRRRRHPERRARAGRAP